MSSQVWFASLLAVAAVTASVVAGSPPIGPEPIGPFVNGRFPSSSPFMGSGVLAEAFPSLDWESPIVAVPFPGGADLLVGEMAGRIYRVLDSDTAETRELVLDITDRAWYYDWAGPNTKHGGMQTFVLHPEFGEGTGNDYVYTYYLHNPTGVRTDPYYDRVARFTWDGSSFDPSSELIMIQQFDTAAGHDGGGMAFGGDGFLYITVGDEGTQGSAAIQHTQRIDDRFRSGVWRIDVDMLGEPISHAIRRQPSSDNVPPSYEVSYTQGYYVPNTNPWQDPDGGVLEEFYAIGLRNPHRLAYDAMTDQFWIGDVGQDSREEVDLMNQPGLNFQWAFKEGTVPGAGEPPTPLIGVSRGPIIEYPHGNAIGNCVIGGVVYRGTLFPGLYGKYLFGDNGSGAVWALQENAGTLLGLTAVTQVPGSLFSGLASFGVDTQGELLLMKMGAQGTGMIYRMVPPHADGPIMPDTISATGVFDDNETLTPAPGFIPYTVNAPLWTAGTIKMRWIAIPNDGVPDSPDELIGYSETGSWTFPVGTVLAKHFAHPDGHPLETRVFVHAYEGWYGATYKWRPDGSDADLLANGGEEELTIDGETFTYLYPAANQCGLCHKANAGSVLGVRTRQLNGPYTYPGGETVNQIEMLSTLGFLPAGLDEAALDGVLTSAALDDPSATLEFRTRSYIDSNCAHCHQPGNAQAFFDARLTTSLFDQGIVCGGVRNDLGITGARIVRPADLDRSLMHLRLISEEGCCAMPPIARGRIDDEAAAVMGEWIESLPVVDEMIGNDTSEDAPFLDAHHPSLYVNESAAFTNTTGSDLVLRIEDFSFYARSPANPITPFLVRIDGDNDFTVVAIGQTRTSAEYGAGQNVFPFVDDVVPTIMLAPWETVTVGFMDSFADGSGWGEGTMIPAVVNGSADEIWALLPAPLIPAAGGFVADRDTPSIALGEAIAVTNAGLAVSPYTGLHRSYKVNVRLVVENDCEVFPPVAAIDSDGDGIPDLVECPQASGTFVANGGFENTAVHPQTWTYLDAGDVEGWQTTSPDNLVEIWTSGFLGVPAFEGEQFCELNGTGSGGGLYQDVATQVGAQLRWRFAHRGRNGPETISLCIGRPGYDMQSVIEVTTDNSAWVVYEGVYEVTNPEQTTTRCMWMSMNGGSSGNLLDAATFGPDCDADGDGIDNYMDDDSDGDGIPDEIEGAGDADGDQVPNFLDLDSDGDGIPDAVECGNRQPEAVGLSGIVRGPRSPWDCDLDGDGTPNFLDPDSDDDGVPDWVEAILNLPPR